MNLTAQQRGGSILSAGFKKSSIWPYVPDKHTQAMFAPSDARLGLSEGCPVEAAAVKRRYSIGVALVQEIFPQVVPKSTVCLEKAAARARAERERLVAEGNRELNLEAGVGRMCCSSEVWARFHEEKK